MNQPHPSLLKRTRADSLSYRNSVIGLDLQSESPRQDYVNIALDLWAGLRKAEVARSRGYSYAFVTAVACAIGWTRDWVIGPIAGARAGTKPRASVIGTMKVEEMLLRFDAGEHLGSIGKRAGVSRERVRQVAKMHGRKPRAEVRAHMKEVRRAQQVQEAAARRLERKTATIEAIKKRWARAERMWREGKTIAVIAAAYGVSTDNMAWYMHSCRRRYGMFPLREPSKSMPRPRGMCGRLTDKEAATRIANGAAPLAVMGDADVSAWRLQRACRAIGVKWPIEDYTLDGVPRRRC